MAEYAKRGYLLENFRLFHLRSESGEKVDFHYHEFCKLLFLVSGQGSYFVDGKRYLLSAGDLVLIGSRSVHKPELAEGSTYERIIIYISPDYLQQMSTQDCDLLSLFSGSHGHVLRLKEQRRKAVFSLVSKLERDLSQEAFGRTILSQADLLHLLVELGRSMEDSAIYICTKQLIAKRKLADCFAGHIYDFYNWHCLFPPSAYAFTELRTNTMPFLAPGTAPFTARMFFSLSIFTTLRF